MKKTKDSPAIVLLDHVWACCNRATGFSWERLNHSMHSALTLAVGGGFRFDLYDMTKMNRFNPGRWIGDDEWVYSLAVAVENIPAMECYENYKLRPRFRADDCESGHMCSGAGYTHGGSHNRKRGVLCVGMGFRVGTTLAWVTDFKDGHVLACIYPTRWQEGKPVRRLRLDQAGIKAAQRPTVTT